MTDDATNITQPAPQVPAVTAVKPARTRGEKWFDRGVYGGINGVVNFLVTIPLAYWALHGKGEKYAKIMGDGLEKLGTKPHIAKELKEMVATSFGGWAMVVPVYVAEHFRKPAVHWLNQTFGSESDKTAVVQHPPKQTMKSLLWGRLGAMATVTVAFRTAGAFFSQQFDNFQHGVAEKLCKFFGKATHDPAMKAAIEKSGVELTRKNLEAAETKAYHYGKMASLDVFATTSATILLYTISRFVAKRRDQHKAERGQAPAVLPAPIAPLADVQSPVASSVPDKMVSGEKLHPGMVMQQPPAQVAQV